MGLSRLVAGYAWDRKSRKDPSAFDYAGAIIGTDLRVAANGPIVADHEAYRDKKGKENTGHLKDAFTDDDLLMFIRNIYGVLLTRGMLGTYVYVCDETLRERLRALLG